MRVAFDSTPWEESNHTALIKLRPPVQKPRPLFQKSPKLCKKWCNMGIIELGTLNTLQIYKVLDLASNNSQAID